MYLYYHHYPPELKTSLNLEVLLYQFSLFPGQAGGLTATLQASNVTTPGTVTQPGVRLAPPVMVSVDPTRAGGMTLQGPGQLVAATASECKCTVH